MTPKTTAELLDAVYSAEDYHSAFDEEMLDHPGAGWSYQGDGYTTRGWRWSPPKRDGA